MPAGRPNKAVCLAVLCAMAYGVGASRCGCWEHSGWRAAVAPFFDGASTPPADESGWFDDECHGEAAPAALLAERTRIESLASIAAPVGLFVARAPIGPERIAFGANDRSGSRAALPVRADLQVFRL